MAPHLAEAQLPARNEAPPSRTRPPILEALRAGTRAAHDRIERNPVMHRLTEPGLDRDHYTLVLRRMLALHEAVETPVAAALAAYHDILALDARRKTPLLRRDLMVLDASVPPRQPIGDLAALVRDEPSAWGTLYVLEGSTLGGRIILRSIERELGYTADTGAAFFAGYGERTGERWKNFVEELAAAHERHPDWEGAIVEAATNCFATMDAWLVAGAA